MLPKLKSSIRPAVPEDITRLQSLIKSEQMVHKHLDWRSPLDRIDESPFLIMQRSGRIIGALSCPPDPPKTAWIQLFLAVAGEYSKSIWNELIQSAILDLENSTAKHLLAIPISPWFSNLLANNGFKEVSRVIVLNLDTRKIDIAHPKSNYKIRDMQISDIQEIEILDRDSFGPVWHNTKRSLEAAFSQAYKATVVLEKETIIGYQISTISSRGIHLARLAILPAYQSKGIASIILIDLINFLNANNKNILSVNTQQNNVCSKSLYKKIGFQPTNEYFQVFGIKINK